MENHGELLDSTDPGQDGVLDDHKELTGLLGRLREARPREELGTLLASLRAVLSRHFQREEGENGLFEIIHARAPRHRQAIEDLRSEHRDFVTDLEELVRRAEQGPQPEQMADHVADFVDRLHQHERNESHLWIDTLSTDLGEGD